MGVRQFSVVPPLLSSITWGGGGGGSPGEKSEPIRSQLKAWLPAHRVWGAAVKAPGCKVCHRLGSVVFFVTLACLDISSKKRCL